MGYLLAEHVELRHGVDELPLVNLVVQDDEADLPREPTTAEELRRILDSGHGDEVRPVNPQVAEIVEMRTDLNVRTRLTIHVLAAFLHLVRLRVDAATIGMDEVEDDFLRHENLGSHLSEVVHVLAALDELPTMLEAEDNLV